MEMLIENVNVHIPQLNNVDISVPLSGNYDPEIQPFNSRGLVRKVVTIGDKDYRVFISTKVFIEEISFKNKDF
jgi:hypothetical protein